MSEIASSDRTKRSRSSAGTQSPRKTTRAAQTKSAAAAQQRHAMIAEGAYLRAAERGFRGGDPVADWLASEREVDALLAAGNPATSPVKSSKKSL